MKGVFNIISFKILDDVIFGILLTSTNKLFVKLRDLVQCRSRYRDALYKNQGNHGLAYSKEKYLNRIIETNYYND